VRRDFVANASHELRTPLTSIKGYTEVLMSDESDPDVRNSCLEVIFKNTNHIIKMVNDLLQLARVEDYDTIASIRPVKADEVLTEAWKTCMPVAEQRSITLQDDLPADGPMVQADFDQLVQVFRNLLENAVKYSPPGGKVEVFSQAQSGKVTIGMSDNGPGIPPEDRDRVFVGEGVLPHDKIISALARVYQGPLSFEVFQYAGQNPYQVAKRGFEGLNRLLQRLEQQA
jgi:two-component system phosphate regulon sensor histidine kinase PhoR